MAKGTDIDSIYAIVQKEFSLHPMPVVELIEIQTHDPFKILVTTILSARTKDGTTAAVARRLFEKAGSLQDLRKIPLPELEKLLFPVGFYKNKARFLHRLPAAIEEKFNGSIPQSVEELIELPGVGRKTANLVVAIAFNKPAICVDIHVHRICNRLGYVTTKTPFDTEMALRKKLPEKYWTTINSYLVSFGQHLCTPVNPHCNICPIFTYCQRVMVKTKYTRKRGS